MNFYNTDYEKTLLGIMINDNSTVEVIEGNVKQEYFQNDFYGNLFVVICSQVKKKGACTIMSLCDELPNVHPSVITEITGSSISSANWEFYVREIRNFWSARELKKSLGEKLETLSPKTSDDVMQSIDSDITRLMTFGKSKSHSAMELASIVTTRFQESMKNKEQYLGFNTGWENLSTIIDGLQLGKLIIIGARPSIGKTAFAVQLASNLCKQKINVCMFSLEMTATSLMTRMISVESNLPIRMITHGINAQSTTQRFITSCNQIADYKLAVYDDGVTNEKELYAKIRVEAKKGTKVFFVDHLGLVRHSNQNMKRVEQLDEITQRLLHLAQELNVVIICLCQLRRDSEGKRPCLADLRDSGAIEQNADICMFLHRERAKGNETQIPTEVIVIKNRDGACGTANMIFNPSQTKFTEDTSNTVSDQKGA